MTPSRPVANRRRRVGLLWVVAAMLVLSLALLWASRSTRLLPALVRIPAPHPTAAQDRDARWSQDLEYLGTELPRLHVDPFHTVDQQDFARAVAEVDTAIPELSDTEISFEVSRLVAMIGDGHTSASIDQVFPLYPVAVELFADGPVVVATSPGHVDLLGALLLETDGVPFDDVLEAGLPFFSGDNDYGKRPKITRLAASPGFVSLAIGRESPRPGQMMYRTRDGRRIEIDLQPLDLVSWQATVVSPVVDVPLAAQHPDSFYWYSYLDESATVFLQYNRCENAPDQRFSEFVDEVFDVIDTRRAERLVIDLRRNGGGDSRVIRPLLQRLGDHRLNDEGRLYVLVGPRTFSSGVSAAVDLQDQTVALFVGRPTGGNPNGYGEVREFTLPNSGIAVGYATRFFQLTETHRDAFTPDVTIDRSSHDYFAGVDPVLEFALADR